MEESRYVNQLSHPEASADLLGSERDGLPFTYVQGMTSCCRGGIELIRLGMNVLSAPFLFTMPTQLEAFACFSNFIENACPLYVQPTLVGVHRGLKVCSQLCYSQIALLTSSCSINASRFWTMSSLSI
jgi:hypothetical protein